jgi:hypothetical protein
MACCAGTVVPAAIRWGFGGETGGKSVCAACPISRSPALLKSGLPGRFGVELYWSVCLLNRHASKALPDRLDLGRFTRRPRRASPAAASIFCASVNSRTLYVVGD